MLDSLQIKNFRIFESLRIDRLGRVNLLVGKNNSGKTCLLEALRVYGHSGVPRVLFDLIKARDEDLDSLVDEDSAQSTRDLSKVELVSITRHPFRNLFHGYRFPADLRQTIEIGPVHGGRLLQLSVEAYIRDGEEPQDLSFVRSKMVSIDELPDGAVLRFVGKIHEGGKEKMSHSTALRYGDLRDWYRPALREAELSSDVRFVPARHMDESELARLWDRVVVRPTLRDHVFKALRLIDPKVQEVVMIQKPRMRERIPILLYDEETRLPLKSLGDGVSHLFHIILATVAARGGMVLFDEIENGIHWSIQPLVWKTLFDLAADLDLQIFATTHSWDCVHAFKDTAKAHESEAMLFHLGRSARPSEHGAIVVTAYDKETLELATMAGLEVR